MGNILKIGDVVMIKSGGPKMTIVMEDQLFRSDGVINIPNMWVCKWFPALDTTCLVDTFHTDSLLICD